MQKSLIKTSEFGPILGEIHFAPDLSQNYVQRGYLGCRARIRCPFWEISNRFGDIVDGQNAHVRPCSEKGLYADTLRDSSKLTPDSCSACLV